MKICILGKYPPIEGGVSTHTYWLARGLAKRGHEVHIVTNADEVEALYRMQLTEQDAAWLTFDDRGAGSLQVHSPAAFSWGAMGHIPRSNPFVSKLTSVATDVVRHYHCEVMLAYYYEPYGVAGWLTSQWTGIPLYLKHAGSDLDRLMRHPDLATTYREILKRVDSVITQPRLMSRFLGMGVEPERLREDVAYGLPPGVFSPLGPVLDIASLACAVTGTESSPQTRFQHGRPTIGVLGKIGESKGTFDLIAALGRLAAQGKSFNFVAMVGEAQASFMAPALIGAGIDTCTTILPLLPNWRVPEFLRACTAACFLERDFPVEIHGPMIAREILACGTCLLLSSEIADKQRYADDLQDGHNVLIVEDPRDITRLAQMVSAVIDQPSAAAAIGARGAALVDARGDYDHYIGQWEALLAAPIGKIGAGLRTEVGPEGANRGLSGQAPPLHPQSVLNTLQAVLPDLVAYLQVRHPALLDDFLNQAKTRDRVPLAQAFCDHALQYVCEAGSSAPASLASALRYARARLTALHAAQGDPPAFALADALRGREINRETVGPLFPIRGQAAFTEEFDHEVAGLFTHAALFGQPVRPAEEIDAALATATQKPTRVLFQRTVNHAACELQVDASTEALLAACEGRETTEAVLASVTQQLGVDVRQRPAAESAMLGALAALHRAGVIIFAEQRPGGGWVGGARTRSAPPVRPSA